MEKNDNLSIHTTARKVQNVNEARLYTATSASRCFSYVTFLLHRKPFQDTMLKLRWARLRRPEMSGRSVILLPRCESQPQLTANPN